MSGPPACDYRLETGKGSVGRLEVWNPSERADRLELLEALVPWMALALDGARSYAVVREAAIGPFS